MTSRAPERRYEALGAVEPVALIALADSILAGGSTINVSSGPEVVAMTVRWIDGDGSFVLGHAILTRCEITLDGVPGCAMWRGRHLEAALAAAVCDAEAERCGPESARVEALVLEFERRRRSELAAEGASVQSTRIGLELAAPFATPGDPLVSRRAASDHSWDEEQ